MQLNLGESISELLFFINSVYIFSDCEDVDCVRSKVFSGSCSEGVEVFCGGLYFIVVVVVT